MSKKTNRRADDTTTQYVGSLAELAIAATKANREKSWAEIARDIQTRAKPGCEPRQVRETGPVTVPAPLTALRDGR